MKDTFLLRLNINSTLSDQPQNQQPVNISTSNNLKTARSAHLNSEFLIPNSELTQVSAFPHGVQHLLRALVGKLLGIIRGVHARSLRDTRKGRALLVC